MLNEAYEGFYKDLEKDMGDRSQTVGASEIGLCARQTFWIKKENTPKGVQRDSDYENSWGARIRGTLMEQMFWVPALRKKYGNKLLFAGEQQKRLVKGNLSATPDGLLINQSYDALRALGIKDIKSDCFAVEGKTVDPRTNLVEAKTAHVYQCNTQLGMFNDLTPYKPVYSLLTYTDCSFWDEVEEFPIKFDPVLYQAAHLRANEIMSAKHGKQLAPEGWIAGGKECSFCPFTQACGVERRGIPYGSKKATAQFTAEISDMIRDHKAVKRIIDNNEIKRKTIEHNIKTRMREKGVRRIPGLVTWSEIAAPERYDNKAIREEFKALGGEPEQFMSLGEPSDRLVIAATPAAGREVTRLSSGLAKRPKAKAKWSIKNVKGKANRNVRRHRNEKRKRNK